jgi:hypothetical protein
VQRCTHQLPLIARSVEGQDLARLTCTDGSCAVEGIGSHQGAHSAPQRSNEHNCKVKKAPTEIWKSRWRTFVRSDVV